MRVLAAYAVVMLICGTLLASCDKPAETIGSSKDPAATEANLRTVRLAATDIDAYARLHLNSKLVGVAILRAADDAPRNEILAPVRLWGRALGQPVHWSTQARFEGEPELRCTVGWKPLTRVYLTHEVDGWTAYAQLAELMELDGLHGLSWQNEFLTVTRYVEKQ